MAILFLQYSYVCTNGPIPFCIPEGILTQIFTWVNKNMNLLWGSAENGIFKLGPCDLFFRCIHSI